VNREILYEISKRKVVRGRLDPELCLYNPKEVYMALIHNERVKNWLKWIAYRYIPPKEKKILLLYPCSTIKPYTESRLYKRLFRTLGKLGSHRNLIHVVTISEPFALVPEEYYIKWNVWYDCPGLFKWWCSKHKQRYVKKYVDECIEILSKTIARYLLRTRSQYLFRMAFIRTCSSTLKINSDHTHRRMIELASSESDINVDLVPPESFVKELVDIRGRLSWDFYGVAHPMAQKYLYCLLSNIIKNF